MLSFLSSLLPAAAALAAVIALVVLAGRTARLTGLARLGSAQRRGRCIDRRLDLQDTLVLDRARRLHIVRCDGREVLLLTGGSSDHVVGWLPGAGAAP